MNLSDPFAGLYGRRVRDGFQSSADGIYQLQRYTLRTVLGIFGPLFLLAFYIVICYYYLNRPPVNGVVTCAPGDLPDARWIFYAWFVIAIFVMDWARTGLANIEAAALMRPRLAPRTAMELMWHTDGNWANFWWWLRGLRSVFVSLKGRLFSRKHHHLLEARPGFLWWFLTATSLLLFISIPLSGLSMELSTAFVNSTRKATITGPGPGTFNLKGGIDIPQTIRGRWRSGGVTTPPTSAILYATADTSKVSTTYYNDVVHDRSHRGPVEIFAGPAVSQNVVGNAWGLQVSITCEKVRRSELQLIKVVDFADYMIITGWEDGKPKFAENPSLSFDLNAPTASQVLWVNETGVWNTEMGYSLVVAAEGTWQGRTPYDEPYGFDPNTSSGQTAIETQQQADRAAGVFPNVTTSAQFEAYLWQGAGIGIPDKAMKKLLNDDSGYVDTHSNVSFAAFPGNPGFTSTDLAGFGIHCDVTSMVGSADLNPAHRTYSAFQGGKTAQQLTQDLFPVQIQTLAAIGNFDPILLQMNARDPAESDSTWLAAHLAIGLLPDPMDISTSNITDDTSPTPYYPALDPEDLTLAMYKLFGESVIAIMDQGGQQAWEGDLYALTPIRYLSPGVIPWQIVLALLVIWTAVVVLASILMVFTRRWAPTLGGFELFKFGAQYANEINRFGDTRFEGCDILHIVPGMVGSLSGTVPRGIYGFIGLSECEANPGAEYVFSRTEAGRSKPG